MFIVCKNHHLCLLLTLFYMVYPIPKQMANSVYLSVNEASPGGLAIKAWGAEANRHRVSLPYCFFIQST
jgi:hypothetical protein